MLWKYYLLEKIDGGSLHIFKISSFVLLRDNFIGFVVISVHVCNGPENRHCSVVVS